ncbi:hypothetical protein NDU88_000483 [Pleurodeles waltl]|uniref:Uncharacterized protein n=1 Tax=Pleurodeles waltl TaxID=8319 RepID=A0AAV7N833_PLEWA|nr:hypothetical protein NDU88_000483 [Pleurodeles waltl]
MQPGLISCPRQAMRLVRQSPIQASPRSRGGSQFTNAAPPSTGAEMREREDTAYFLWGGPPPRCKALRHNPPSTCSSAQAAPVQRPTRTWPQIPTEARRRPPLSSAGRGPGMRLPVQPQAASVRQPPERFSVPPTFPNAGSPPAPGRPEALAPDPPLLQA